MPKVVQQLLRYGVVGVLALALDVGIFTLLRAQEADLLLANTLARLSGALTAQAGNYLWTFEARARQVAWWGSAVRYTALWIFATLLSTAALAAIATQLQMSGWVEATVKLAVEVCIVVFNFFVSRHWVFR